MAGHCIDRRRHFLERTVLRSSPRQCRAVEYQPTLMVPANNSRSVTGKMIDAQSIVGNRRDGGIQPNKFELVSATRLSSEIQRVCTPTLLQPLTAAYVKVFGRLHDDPIHTRRRQAFEKHQWTKSREVWRLRCVGLYERLFGMWTPMRTVERRVMPSPLWNQRAPTTRACWHRS
jgi:hypothetical protein